MKYLGNFIDKQPEGCIEHFLNTKGKVVPDMAIDCFQDGFTEDIYHNGGAKLHGNHTWEVFNKISNNLDYDMYFPVEYKDCDYEIEIVKQLPGQYLPSHRDPQPEHTVRYCMALTDYEMGHILVWGEDFLQNYKKGDTWEISNIYDWHASGNLSYEPRIFAHLTIWHKE